MGHTPGPWVARERHPNYKGWVVVAQTPHGLRRVDDKEGVFSAPDARLIAAAPEMLGFIRLVANYSEAAWANDPKTQLAAFAIEAQDLLKRIEGK